MSTAMSSARPEVAGDKATWLKKAVNYVSVNLSLFCKLIDYLQDKT